jgi:lipid-binding SYLF domain-containing protein
MKKLLATMILGTAMMTGLIGCATTPRDNQAAMKQGAQDAIAEFRRLDPSIDAFFKSSVGYAVFPNIGKGGVVFGGSYGRGVVYERGVAVGWCAVRHGSFGLQLGGQSFSQIIFLQDARTLANFKVGKFELAANASAIAVKNGVAASSDYEKGVAIFVAPRSGLMVEAAVGGQKFDYEPAGR